MHLIDTHCHIYVDAFEADQEAMLERARQAGVERLLMPAIDNETHAAMLALEDRHPGVCLSMMGVHPCSVKENFEEELSVARRYLQQRKFAAVGEIGLDFYWDKTFTAQQYEAFRIQIDWALELNLPIVIHSRESIDECIAEVNKKQKGKLRGVFHCFGGTIEQAKQITGLGFNMGIGGVLTYKKSGLDILLKELPLDQVILETDAPYLTPVPFRGKRNEPAYIRYVAEKLAEVKGLPVEEIAELTSKNAMNLFGI